MKLITISGLDGSGKSTQIEMLKNYLASQGKKVFYFHAIQFGIANKLKSISKNKRVLFPRPCEQDSFLTEEKSVVKAGRFKIFLRKVFLKIDLLRFKKLVARLEKEGYDYLISDRYFYDNVVNIEYLESSLSRPSGTLSQRERGIKIPDVAIYLQVSPEMIMQRERKPDQGLEYLQKKKEIYDKYASIWNLKIIDGNRSKEEVFEEIKSLLK